MHDCCDMRADGLTFYLQSKMKSDPQLMERIIIHGSNVIVNHFNGPLLLNAIASHCTFSTWKTIQVLQEEYHIFFSRS